MSYRRPGGSDELSGVTHRYRSSTAVDNVTLSLQPGITGLLGPNGSGKTTMMRILATVTDPTAGSVRILDRDARDESSRLEIRRRLGYVPQELAFARGFTTFGFTEYMAVLKEWTDPATRRAEVRRVLALVGLSAVATKRVHRLSGGMRRRLGLAQALLGRPELLLLDEPTTGLDPEQRAAFRELVLALGREGGTVVISTHQTEDVAALCDRLVVLDAGRVGYDGPLHHFVARAEGRVWVADAPDRTALAHHRSASGRYRHVGEPPAVAELADPAVEDAYLLLRTEQT
jgi:ABC-2 type transport system ATP-binding protein